VFGGRTDAGLFSTLCERVDFQAVAEELRGHRIAGWRAGAIRAVVSFQAGLGSRADP